jgi:hypothetical protein
MIACSPRKNFSIKIEKSDPIVGDSTGENPVHHSAVISFIYFDEGNYFISVDNIPMGKGKLKHYNSNCSGDCQLNELIESDTIKVEVNNYNPIQFCYDNRYGHIYLWGGGDSLRIQYTNEKYLFD